VKKLNATIRTEELRKRILFHIIKLRPEGAIEI
jgi:hypothetical protein